MCVVSVYLAIWEDSEVLYQVLVAYGAGGGAVQAAVCEAS